MRKISLIVLLQVIVGLNILNQFVGNNIQHLLGHFLMLEDAEVVIVS
jgi:hypothetical protein